MTDVGSESDNSDNSEFPVECVLRDYKFKAKKKDSNGKECRGEIQAQACYGYCDTFEVLYKVSKKPWKDS